MRCATVGISPTACCRSCASRSLKPLNDFGMILDWLIDSDQKVGNGAVRHGVGYRH
jgi:hypothetical protein